MKLQITNEKLRGVAITVGVFVGGLLLVSLLLDFIVMPLAVRGGSEVRVPDVVEMSLQAAEARLDEAGLESFTSEEVYDSETPKGSVIAQRPEGGATVKKGRRVFLTISRGSASATVPSLVGYTLREARFLLEKEGLQPGSIVWILDETRPDGVILGSVPISGTVMKLNARVELLVNRRETEMTVTVPNFVGRDLEQARLMAEESFLLIGELTVVVDNSLLPETVTSQSIPGGSYVRKWSVVDLTISVLE